MIDAIDKKQMHDSAIMGKDNASKEWTCIVPMFLTSFNVYFVFRFAYFKCICLQTAIWLFLRQGLAFLVKTGWQPCFGVCDAVVNTLMFEKCHVL